MRNLINNDKELNDKERIAIIKVESENTRKAAKIKVHGKLNMGRRDTEKRQEALKLANEIGGAEAARRQGTRKDTLCGWRGRQNSSEPLCRMPSAAAVKRICSPRINDCEQN